jgi:YHS domain-containing protein
MQNRIAAFAAGLMLTMGAAEAGIVNTENGVAIKGYDPVAYFTQHQAVKGSAAFQAGYDGATYWFASAEDKALFEQQPAHYAPRYDGFCAFGAAQGHKADIDPTAFSIIGGQLYLNYSHDVQAQWKTDIPGYIAKADQSWPEVSKSTEVVR